MSASTPHAFCPSAYRRLDVDEFKRSVLVRNGASAVRKMIPSQGDYHGLRKGQTFESSIFLPLNGDSQRRQPGLLDHDRRTLPIHSWPNGQYPFDSGRDSDKASVASTYASIGSKAKNKENANSVDERFDSRRKSKRIIKRVPSKTRSNFLRPKFPYKNYISRVTTSKGKSVFPPPPPPADEHSAEEAEKEMMHRQRGKPNETVVSQVTFAMHPTNNSHNSNVNHNNNINHNNVNHNINNINYNAVYKQQQNGQMNHAMNHGMNHGMNHAPGPVRFQPETIRKSQSHHMISPNAVQEPVKTQPLTRSAPLHDWRRLIDEDAPPTDDVVAATIDRASNDNNDASRRSPEDLDLRSPSVAERALFWRRSRSTDAITASLTATNRSSQSRQPSPRRRSFEEQQVDECFSPEDKSPTGSPKNDLSPPQKRINGILKKSPSPEIEEVDVGIRKMSDSSDDFSPPQSDLNSQSVEKFKEMRREAEMLLRYFRTHRDILNYLGIGLSENLWLQVRSLSKTPLVELTELYDSAKTDIPPNDSSFMFAGEQHGVGKDSSSNGSAGSVKKESILLKKKKKFKSLISSSKSSSPKKVSPTASVQPMPIRESPEMARRESVEMARRESVEMARRESVEMARRESVEMARRESAEMIRREQAELQRREQQEVYRRDHTESLRREQPESLRRETPVTIVRREHVIEPIRREPPKQLGRSLSAPFASVGLKEAPVNRGQYVASRQGSMSNEEEEEEEYDDYAAEEKRVFAERDIDQAVRESKEKYDSHVVEEEDIREEILHDFEDVSKQMADSRHTSVSSSLERNHSAHQKSLQFSNHPKTIPEVEPVREQHGDVKRVGFPASLDRGVDDETTANRGRQSATNGRNDEFEYHKYDFIEQERADDGRRYGSSSFVQDFQPEKSESRTGRFVKKSAAAIIARKQTSSVNTNVNVVNLNGSTSPPKRMPVQENKKANGQNGDGNKAVGESRIAAEIRNLREREDELRRSRSELGLPSLEDIVDTWRNGYGSQQQLKPVMPPLRGARSYDHLHLAVEESSPIVNGTEPRVTKSGSVDHLHQAHIYERSATNVDEGYFTYQSDQSMTQAQYGSERPAGAQRSRKVRIANDDRRERFVQEMAQAPPPAPAPSQNNNSRGSVEEKIRSDVIAALKREEEHRRERERALQQRQMETEDYASHRQIHRQQHFNMEVPTSVRL